LGSDHYLYNLLCVMACLGRHCHLFIGVLIILSLIVKRRLCDSGAGILFFYFISLKESFLLFIFLFFYFKIFWVLSTGEFSVLLTVSETATGLQSYQLLDYQINVSKGSRQIRFVPLVKGLALGVDI